MIKTENKNVSYMYIMESIQITGNKARFDNYLTSPMKVPENAKVCLNKASFSIPVWTQKYIEVPRIADAADRAKNMLRCNLNGVSNDITWDEFHAAWVATNPIELRSANEFYNGTYKFWMNNTLELFNALGNVQKLPTFSEVLAHALATKFSFYEFNAVNEILPTQRVDTVAGDTITINAQDYIVTPSDEDIKNLGIDAQYAPEKVSALTPVTMNQYWAGADFTRLGDNLTFNGVNSSYAIAKDTLGNAWAIDPNGGYWNFRADLNDANSSVTCGIIFTSQESKPNTTSPTTITADSIQVGIKFSYDGTSFTFQAVDGLETFSHAGTINYDEVLYPRDNVFTYDNDVDEWFIQIRRAAGYETGANKFVFRLWHGDINNAGFNNAECFYQSEMTLPSPDIFAVPIILSNNTGGGAGTNEIKDNFIIDVLPDSVDMGDSSNIFSERAIELIPATDAGNNESVFTFWSHIGLSQNGAESRSKISYNSSTLANKIIWNIGDVEKKYFIGVDSTLSIFQNGLQHLRLTTNGQAELPRQIEVSLLNLAHTPHTGSFAQEVLFTEPDINKVISYINTDPKYFNASNNIYLEYVYEAFNLVCRRLKNRSELNLGQFQISLGYKNFITNLNENIAQLRGIVKLEILFEQADEKI